MKKITIGIPKAFLFYRYNILWTTYLKKLKCKIIYSNNTNKNTIRLGNTYSIDESCLSSKIYLGHVAEIKDICDFYHFRCRYTLILVYLYTLKVSDSHRK